MLKPFEKINKPSLKIGFFDSGLGGLTILKKTQEILPSASYVFCLDNAFFPYSEKNVQDLIARVTNQVLLLQAKENLDLLVLACNTASVSCLTSLRKHLTIPIVGVVPAIKPAFTMSTSKVIGLLATKTTVNSSYTEALITSFAKDAQIIRIGSTKFVELAEAKLRGEALDLNNFKKELESFRTCQKLDTVILGCTHFPHLLDELKFAVLPKNLNWIDSSLAVAKRVSDLVTTQYTQEASHQKNTIYSTKIFEMNYFLSKMLKNDYQFEYFKLLN